MKTYRVVVERDESGAWLARVPSVPGCHTYGRTLEAARRRIHDALGLWVNDLDRARLDFDVRLPREAREVVRPFESARQRAENAQHEVQEALDSAAKTLVQSGFSLRDAGEVLGLSHQRVAQVVAARRYRRAAPRSSRRLKVRAPAISKSTTEPPA